MSIQPEHRALWSGLYTEATDAEIGLLGVPFDRAVSWRSGASQAPDRMRSLTPHLANITEEGLPLTIGVRDYGNVEPDLNWGRYFETVEQRARRLISNSHHFTLFIGGDHSVGIPLFKAFARSVNGPVGYIQFDSHADLCDTFEGHIWSHASTARRNVEQSNLSYERMAFVGLRSFLREELAIKAANPQLGWYTARDVYRDGIKAVAQKIIAQMQGLESIYFSLDIDGLDPSCAPGTGTPEHGGPTTRECLEFLRLIFTALPIKVMDVVEVSPPLDISDMTSLVALKIIYEVFGFVQLKVNLPSKR